MNKIRKVQVKRWSQQWNMLAENQLNLIFPDRRQDPDWWRKSFPGKPGERHRKYIERHKPKKARMAIALVQTWAYAGGDGDTTIALSGSATTTGSLLVVCAGQNGEGTNVISSIADSAGNSGWASSGTANTTGRYAHQWHCPNAASVTTVTVTFQSNIPAATAGGCCLFEISDALTTSPVKGTSTGNGTSTSGTDTFAVGGFTPSQNDTFIISNCWLGSTASYSAGTDMTLGPTGVRFASAYRTLGTASSQTAPITETGTATSAWGMFAVAYGEDTGGGGPTEKSGSDNLTVSITDAATGLFSQSSRTDNLNLQISEAVALQQNLNGTGDDLNIQISEAAAEIIVALSRAEDLNISLSEAAATILSLLSRADSLGISISEVKELLALSDRADNLSISITEAAATIVVALNRSENLNIQITEETVSILVLLSRLDDLNISLSEVKDLLSVSNRADNLDLALSEVATVVVNLLTSDNLSISISEATSLIVAILVAENLNVSLTEAAVIFGVMSRSDNLNISLSEDATLGEVTGSIDAYLRRYANDV